MNAPIQSRIPLLELDLLKTLVAIAETGNFSAAAEAVFRTPSAISMQVKRLEEIVNRPVFVRDSRSVSLTSDGELLLEHARRVLALNRDMISKFVTPEVGGVVTLGSPDDVSERFLPGMLQLFHNSHPGVNVNVVVEDSPYLIKGIKDKSIDIAIVSCNGQQQREGAEIVHREQLVWASLKGGVAGERNPLPVSVWEEGCFWRRSALDSLNKAKRDYRIAFQSSYISGQKAAILADLVVAPMPVSSLSDKIVEAKAEWQLPDLPDYGIGLLVRKDANAAINAAVDHLRASFAKCC